MNYKAFKFFGSVNDIISPEFNFQPPLYGGIQLESSSFIPCNPLDPKYVKVYRIFKYKYKIRTPGHISYEHLLMTLKGIES